MQRIVAACLMVWFGTSAAAQTMLASYYAEISQQDMFNSSGARLSDLGAILQQDRANFHRFGRADLGDDVDPFFGDSDLRARIPQLYARGNTDPLIANIIAEGNPLAVLVLLCGNGGRLDYIVVDFADGDGYRTC